MPLNISSPSQYVNFTISFSVNSLSDSAQKPEIIKKKFLLFEILVKKTLNCQLHKLEHSPTSY